MNEILTIENLIALLTLSAMEIVLGIDNIVLIAVLTGKLKPGEQAPARRLGIGAAMISRIVLLVGIGWVTRLTNPFFTLAEHPFSGRDLIMLVGGLFLIAKATHEIHHKIEDHETQTGTPKGKTPSFRSVIIQIMIMDIIFSLDSVITAVGMAKSLAVMIAAVMIAVFVMLAFAGFISSFIERHPTLKMLALSFMLLIGVMLLAEGFGRHVEKGYIYSAMAFSLFVEVLNIRAHRIRAAKSA